MVCRVLSADHAAKTSKPIHMTTKADNSFALNVLILDTPFNARV